MRCRCSSERVLVQYRTNAVPKECRYDAAPMHMHMLCHAIAVLKVCRCSADAVLKEFLCSSERVSVRCQLRIGHSPPSPLMSFPIRLSSLKVVVRFKKSAITAAPPSPMRLNLKEKCMLDASLYKRACPSVRRLVRWLAERWSLMLVHGIASRYRVQWCFKSI